MVVFSPADSTNDYNKGVGLSRYVHMNFNNDSIVYYALSDLTGSQLHTYAGGLNKLFENDTVQKAIKVIRELSTGFTKEAPVLDGIGYCGVELYFEYVHGSKTTRLYLRDSLDERLKNFAYYFLEYVEERLWSKETFPNKVVSRDSIVVNALKNLGFYDSIRPLRPSYIPLPCGKGIELENLYGSWRSIGDEYNDARFRYWIIEIDAAGNWVMDRVDCNTTTRKYSGSIKALDKTELTIELIGEHRPVTLEIMNLTENCFQFRHKKSKQVWRLDRME